MTKQTDLDIGAEQYYHEQLNQGIFKIQKCLETGKSIFYPRMVSPYSGTDQLEWYEPSGNGVVYATTTVRRKPEKGGNYNVCLIDLEEGPRLMSRVENINPEDVKIGLKVKAKVKKQDDDSNILVFIPAE